MLATVIIINLFTFAILIRKLYFHDKFGQYFFFVRNMPLFVNFSISFVGHDNERDKGIGIADLTLEKKKSLGKKKKTSCTEPSMQPEYRQKAGRTENFRSFIRQRDIFLIVHISPLFSTDRRHSSLSL